MASVPQRGDFVRVRSRRWLVEDERPIEGLKTLSLACVDDDAQGELAEVLWDAEIDGSVLGDEGWASVANRGTDDPSVFSAYFRTLRWNTATAADRDLFQAPFRAGIRQDASQLLPLRKALRLPRDGVSDNAQGRSPRTHQWQPSVSSRRPKPIMQLNAKSTAGKEMIFRMGISRAFLSVR